MFRISKNKLPKYNGTEFFDNVRKEYKDRAREPLFRNKKISYKNRDYLLKTLPFSENSDGRMESNFDNVFAPFVTSADPLWLTGVNKGYWNQNFGPFTAVYYVIRDHFRDFYSLVDGVVVSDRKDFEKRKEDFNRIWHRVLLGKGNGAAKGCCSVSEMIRIGSLFYILQKSSESGEGIAINNEKKYNGSFGGEKVVFDIDKKKFKQYQKKIENTYFSDISWKKFMMRYVPSTDEDTLWYISIPNIYSNFYSNRMELVDNFDWFDINGLSKIFEFVKPINNRNGKLCIFFEQNSDMCSSFKNMFGSASKMRLTDTTTSVGESFYLHTDLGSMANKYAAFTNYSPSNEILE